MCGGIGFKIAQFSKRDLRKYFSDEQIAAAESSGELEIFYWSHRPMLPAIIRGKYELIDWGNRDDKLSLPNTGWARIESLDSGKWDYLKPKYIDIVAAKGYEKGVWFSLSKNIQGLLVEKDNERRAYIVTVEASPQYKKMTHHDREPVLV